MSETLDQTAPPLPQAQPAAPAPNPPAATEAAPAKPADIFAMAEGTAPATPAGQRPEWCPEQFWDAAKGQPLTEALAKSWGDFRGKVARGEGRLPETPEAYALPAIEGMPADFVKADDPLWTEVRTAAHKAGITQPQMDALLKPYFGALAKVVPAAATEPDQAAAYQAEIGKLGPNGRQVVADLGGWLAGLHARGVLSAEELGDLRSVGTAHGVRALAKLRELSGERAIPTEAMDAASMTETDARRMLREGYAKGDEALTTRARRALEELERKGMLRA